jgi:hypothetical protein
MREALFFKKENEEGLRGGTLNPRRRKKNAEAYRRLL